MTSRNKKKRQQRAQSLQALARERQRQRELRQQTLALRAEKRWSNTLRQLDMLGAQVQTQEQMVDGISQTFYAVTYEGQVHQFPTRSRLQRWFKPKRKRQEEEQMSWAERHVQWMIDNNCDDHGNPWPSDELD